MASLHIFLYVMRVHADTESPRHLYSAKMLGSGVCLSNVSCFSVRQLLGNLVVH